MDFLQNHIEALVFCSPSPIKVVDIKACLSEMFNADVPDEDIDGAIQRLEEKFQGEEYSFQLFKAAGGYQFLTKPAYQASIGIMLKQQSKKRLSTSAMETLSIIAYKQPISKTEIENIRGVNCDYAVQKLLDKSLIEITGKADTIGRPMLYGTTMKFMEYFGINTLNELPAPKEFTGDVNSIGESTDSKDDGSATTKIAQGNGADTPAMEDVAVETAVAIEDTATEEIESTDTEIGDEAVDTEIAMEKLSEEETESAESIDTEIEDTASQNVKAVTVNTTENDSETPEAADIEQSDATTGESPDTTEEESTDLKKPDAQAE